MGISVVTGESYQGPFEEAWPAAAMIVFNVYDPCSDSPIAETAIEVGETIDETVSETVETITGLEEVPPPQVFSSQLGRWIVGLALASVIVGSLILRRRPSQNA